MSYQPEDVTKQVVMPFKIVQRTLSTDHLEDVERLATAGATSLNDQQRNGHYVLVNSPVYVVQALQYAVDLDDVSDDDREEIRQRLQRTQISYRLISSGAITLDI